MLKVSAPAGMLDAGGLAPACNVMSAVHQGIGISASLDGARAAFHKHIRMPEHMAEMRVCANYQVVVMRISADIGGSGLPAGAELPALPATSTADGVQVEPGATPCVFVDWLQT